MRIKIKVWLFTITITSEDIAEAMQTAFKLTDDQVEDVITFLDKMAMTAFLHE